MRIHLVENPSAGRGEAHAVLEAVRGAFLAAGHAVTSYAGREPGDISRHVGLLRAEEVDRLLLAGGDGTLRSVVNARADPPPWPIGVLPVGTANLVARETGLKPGAPPAETARRLLAAREWPVDLLEVRRDGRFVERAVTTVSVGLDGEIVHRVARIRTGGLATGGYGRWVGPTGRAIAGFAFHPVTATVDGEAVLTGTTVVVQNSHVYGGVLTLSPSARLDSGVLDVVALAARGRADLVEFLLAARSGRLARARRVRILRGRSVSLCAPTPVAVQVDGDPAGWTDLEVVLRPGALRLLAVPRA